MLDEVDDTIKQRLIDKDVDITAPMWGAGELMTSDEPLALEQSIAEQNNEFCQGLPRFGLKQERRRIRLTISDADIELLPSQEAENAVKVSFTLPAGCYATTVLRELVNYQDMTARVDKRTIEATPQG